VTQLVLEAPDLRTDRGLRPVERRSRTRKRAMIRDREEGAEKVGIELRRTHDDP
jgi:hypothetical protein